jgi:hypothetical protein
MSYELTPKIDVALIKKDLFHGMTNIMYSVLGKVGKMERVPAPENEKMTYHRMLTDELLGEFYETWTPLYEAVKKYGTENDVVDLQANLLEQIVDIDAIITPKGWSRDALGVMQLAIGADEWDIDMHRNLRSYVIKKNNYPENAGKFFHTI